MYLQIVPCKNDNALLHTNNWFFEYESRGIPTPELIDNNLSLADIKGQNMIDNTMYAVVYTVTSYVSWEDLER